MTNTEELEEQEDQPHVGWKPKVITGGKGPPDEPTTDWMSALSAGTTFVCRQNTSTVDGELYMLVFKGEQFFLLKYCLPDGKIWDRYVSPKSFCKIYKEYEVLGIKQEEQKAPEGDEDVHEQRNRTDRPADVVLDAPDQGDGGVS